MWMNEKKDVWKRIRWLAEEIAEVRKELKEAVKGRIEDLGTCSGCLGVFKKDALKCVPSVNMQLLFPRDILSGHDFCTQCRPLYSRIHIDEKGHERYYLNSEQEVNKNGTPIKKGKKK